MTLTLECAIQSPSMSAPVPPGFTTQCFTVRDVEYRKAIDPHGCVWYYNDGQWQLEVPYFSGRNADIAVIEHISGTRARHHITKGGVIHIGKRRIPPGKWHH